MLDFLEPLALLDFLEPLVFLEFLVFHYGVST